MASVTYKSVISTAISGLNTIQSAIASKGLCSSPVNTSASTLLTVDEMASYIKNNLMVIPTATYTVSGSGTADITNYKTLSVAAGAYSISGSGRLITATISASGWIAAGSKTYTVGYGACSGPTISSPTYNSSTEKYDIGASHIVSTAGWFDAGTHSNTLSLSASTHSLGLSVSGGSVTINTSVSNMATSSSATSYYFTVGGTANNGSATASVSTTAGYCPGSDGTSSTKAVSVGVNGGKTVYIQAAVAHNGYITTPGYIPKDTQVYTLSYDSTNKCVDFIFN